MIRVDLTWKALYMLGYEGDHGDPTDVLISEMLAHRVSVRACWAVKPPNPDGLVPRLVGLLSQDQLSQAWNFAAQLGSPIELSDVDGQIEARSNFSSAVAFEPISGRGRTRAEAVLRLVQQEWMRWDCKCQAVLNLHGFQHDPAAWRWLFETLERLGKEAAQGESCNEVGL